MTKDDVLFGDLARLPRPVRVFLLTGEPRKAGALVLAGWTLTGAWERATLSHPVGFCLESPQPVALPGCEVRR